VLLAAVLGAAAIAAPSGDPPPAPDRFNPVPPTTLTLTHARMKPAQGGQRVRVTIPASPGTNAFGDTVAYRWDTGVDGGARCQPGALPDLSDVSAGTVIDALLPRARKGWCRGSYGVKLEAVVTVNCQNDPPEECEYYRHDTQEVAYASFEVGSFPKSICHTRGEVERCWISPTYRDPPMWILEAPLDDLLGPDGGTSDADPYFERAFRRHPLMQNHWETDDDSFYGYPTSRAEAVRMTAIVDEVLRSGPYHGKDWPGRPRP
jgi:hypothetical protein